MSKQPDQPVRRSLTAQRQTREAAALRANLLKRKNQSRLRETLKDTPDRLGGEADSHSPNAEL